MLPEVDDRMDCCGHCGHDPRAVVEVRRWEYSMGFCSATWLAWLGAW